MSDFIDLMMEIRAAAERRILSSISIALRDAAELQGCQTDDCAAAGEPGNPTPAIRGPEV